MSNAPWMSRWQRSPRQDRRVVEDGVFVELGKVHIPEKPVEEVEVNTALEVVNEPNSGASATGNVPNDALDGQSEIGLGPSEQPDEANRPTEAGVVQDVSNPAISSTEELTEEQSDALAETLRLPEDDSY